MLYVSAVDGFMSGWGQAAGKQNVYVVECETPEQAKIAAANLRNRSEMRNVKTSEIKPVDTDRLHVSFALPGHVYHRPGAIQRRRVDD